MLLRSKTLSVSGSALIISLIATQGYAATRRDDVPDSTVIANSAAPQFGSAGYIFGSSQFSLGGGVLIRPDWVLTAAHVVTVEGQRQNVVSPSSVTFGQGPMIPPNLAGTSTVSQIFVAPQYNGKMIQRGFDLALLHLTAPIANAVTTPIYTASLGSERNRVTTLVGYGNSGTGTTGASPFFSTDDSRTRRATTNTIDAFGGETVVGGSLTGFSSNIFFEDFDSPDGLNNSTGSAIPTATEGLSTNGDSGGPLYTNVGGQQYVAGLVSFGSSFDGNTNSDYGDLTGATVVSQFEGFINSTIAREEAHPQSLTAVPEPSIGGLLVLTGFGLRRRCRRQN